jgi:hypothetical protein
VLRSERNESEIGLLSAFRTRFDGYTESVVESVSPASRTTVVSDGSVESFEFVAKRLWDIFVRDLFFGFSDLFMSSDLFFDLVPF